MLLLPSISGLLDEHFIHEKHKTYNYELKKARLFVVLPLTFIAIGIVCEIISLCIGNNGDMPHIVIGSFLCIIPLLLFRKFGNIVVSGNILTTIFALVVGETVFRTGGLYSDNLLWLMVAPLLAMLFSGKASGAFWLAALCGFAYYVYTLEPGGAHGYRAYDERFDNQYFFISYVIMFFGYTFMVGVFVAGSEILARELIAQKDQCQIRTVEATQKAEALEIAESKLLTKNMELEQFASAASHDLREPLRMIATYSSLLNRRLNGQLDDLNQECLGFVIDGASRMETMLSDLLTFAKLGNEGERYEKLNLNQAINQATVNLTFRIQETQAVVKCDKLPIVTAAETQMVRLFQNLMSNSIKFARKGINPEITIRYENENGKFHHIYFQDNGIGIPDEGRERIFNVFERLNARAEYDGAGIGLASCKKIVNNLGGTIAVLDSPDGVGTLFKISIPAEVEVVKEIVIENQFKNEVASNPMPLRLPSLQNLAPVGYRTAGAV
ncbi:MAG: hypothetical protein IT258_14915 [Saprospiraceae bacterium]|nr:hypothetical protein [Saprospiraceae bacterium]